MYVTILLALACVVGLYVLLRKTSRRLDARRRVANVKKEEAGLPPVPRSTPYRAVAVSGDCDAIDCLKGKRFLLGEAPQLPVPDCIKARCQCKYKHFPDRRDGDPDRRAMSGLQAELYQHAKNMERRIARGRRASDLAMA